MTKNRGVTIGELAMADPPLPIRNQYNEARVLQYTTTLGGVVYYLDTNKLFYKEWPTLCFTDVRFFTCLSNGTAWYEDQTA